MKKALIIFLSMVLIFTLAACSGVGGKAPSERIPPAESGNNSSGQKAEAFKVEDGQTASLR